MACQHAWAAAVQNMLLASHALGLGSVWYIHKKSVKTLLNMDDKKVLLAFVCLGKPAKDSAQTPRKPVFQKTVFIE